MMIMSEQFSHYNRLSVYNLLSRARERHEKSILFKITKKNGTRLNWKSLKTLKLLSSLIIITINPQNKFKCELKTLNHQTSLVINVCK